MLNQFSRTQLLFGPEAMNKLSQCRVAVFGIGGVGGYAVEALVRSGIGTLDLIDDDRFGLWKTRQSVAAVIASVRPVPGNVRSGGIFPAPPRLFLLLPA